MKRCFLCDSEEGVIEFNDDTFRKWFLISLFRASKKFKYSDVVLTIESVKKYGYHVACYKKRTALKQRYIAEFNVLCPKPTVIIILKS